MLTVPFALILKPSLIIAHVAVFAVVEDQPSAFDDVDAPAFVLWACAVRIRSLETLDRRAGFVELDVGGSGEAVDAAKPAALAVAFGKHRDPHDPRAVRLGPDRRFRDARVDLAVGARGHDAASAVPRPRAMAARSSSRDRATRSLVHWTHDPVLTHRIGSWPRLHGFPPRYVTSPRSAACSRSDFTKSVIPRPPWRADPHRRAGTLPPFLFPSQPRLFVPRGTRPRWSGASRRIARTRSSGTRASVARCR